MFLHAIRPHVEALEDRCLLSGADLTVMSYNLFQGSELTPTLPAGPSWTWSRR
jgi:hypothetical protein